MKKIFILLLFFINISCFAETKIYNGIGLAKDTFLSETLKKTKMYNGTNYTKDIFAVERIKILDGLKENSFAFNFGLESKYKYFEENFTFTYCQSYINFTSSTKLKYNIFYIGNDLEFGTQTQYCDFTVGTYFNHKVFNWLEVFCDAKVGYISSYIRGEWEINNLYLSSVQFEVLMFNCIYFYAGMESKQQYITFFSYNPYLIRNNIGVKFEWTINNFGFYAYTKYYCEHPEVGYEYFNTHLNRNKRLCSVGFFYKL